MDLLGALMLALLIQDVAFFLVVYYLKGPMAAEGAWLRWSWIWLACGTWTMIITRLALAVTIVDRTQDFAIRLIAEAVLPNLRMAFFTMAIAMGAIHAHVRKLKGDGGEGG